MKLLIPGIIALSAVVAFLMLSAQTAPPAPASRPSKPRQLQSADDIVARYVAAVGGKDAISQVVALSMEASISIMGNDAPSTTTVLDGGLQNRNGSGIVQCYTDKGGWQVNPMTGSLPDPAPWRKTSTTREKASFTLPANSMTTRRGAAKLNCSAKTPASIN